MIDKLSLVAHVCPEPMLISFSVDEILLPGYVNWSTNIRGLPLTVDMAPS